ncbi:MAG: ParB/RepB/Spo0J family partition protein [Hyphomonadaceae bacterium]|nr:ParB/RepB/Spo0J family partition protein [Hyphomonadaceae bacterium]
MADKNKQNERGLGRGLSALMSDAGLGGFGNDSLAVSAVTPAKDSLGIHTVTVDQLVRNPDQPRRDFDKERLAELSESIRDKGVLQPILVRPLPESVSRQKKIPVFGKPVYQIIAGERRWQAAMGAGLDTMPVFIRNITDQEALEIGVVENVQRTDLNPMEEAEAYRTLMTRFDRTQADIADAVGKSRSYIANMLRLLNLPDRVQTYLSKGKISMGHARAIIAAPDPASLADTIIDKELSVREAERWVRKIRTAITGSDAVKARKSADDRRLEAELVDALGLDVDLKHKGPGGELRIRYKSEDQLDGIVKRLRK